MANFLHTFAAFHKAVGAFLGIKEAQTNVEKKVRKALTARREAAAAADHKRIKTFDTFLLKFPKADSAFQEIRKQFQTFGTWDHRYALFHRRNAVHSLLLTSFGHPSLAGFLFSPRPLAVMIPVRIARLN